MEFGRGRSQLQDLRHKSKQDHQLIHSDLSLDGGSRLPPVAEEKNAACGLKLDEERVSSGRERDQARSPRALWVSGEAGIVRLRKALTNVACGSRPGTHLSQVSQLRPLHFSAVATHRFQYSWWRLGARSAVRPSPWASASILVTGGSEDRDPTTSQKTPGTHVEQFSLHRQLTRVWAGLARRPHPWGGA